MVLVSNPLGGVIDPKATMDREEADECRKMHEIIERHDLKSSVRWVVAQKNRVRNGELYRYVADMRGAFAQPALYEGEPRCGCLQDGEGGVAVVA